MSSKRVIVVLGGVAVAVVSAIVIWRAPDHVLPMPGARQRQDIAQRNAATGATAPVPAGEGAQLTPAHAPVGIHMEWAKAFDGTGNYFDFVSKAARPAFNGDGGAALYISKTLYICSPIAKQYAHSADPDADFNAYWAGMTKAPSWIVDRARKDFQSCVGFIKGDAFASLPARPGGYDSIRYWIDRATSAKDPVALSLQAGAQISSMVFVKDAEVKPNSLEAAQLAIDDAVASRDPAALFHVGQLLSDGHASTDPLEGFAVSIAACNLGYDCTATNAELFRGCAAQGQCPPGINYSDVIRQAVGDAGYAQAYARAQQLEDALARGDPSTVQQLVRLKH